MLRHSRDETRKIAKDKGHALSRNWKCCLECVSSKKQMNLTNYVKHKVADNLCECMIGDATIVENPKDLKETVGRPRQQLMVYEANQKKISDFH